MVLYEISTLDLKLKKSFRKFEVFIDEALFWLRHVLGVAKDS